MSTTTKYVPYDYRRVCDICANVRNISQMRKLPGAVWVCSYHPQERTETQLSEEVAKRRPVRVLPVPNPKPQNPDYPNTFRADDAAAFNLITQAVSLASQYQDVTSGSGAFISGQPALQTYGWACRYFYDLIQQNTAQPVMLAQAVTNLKLAANSLQALQVGFGTSPTSTRASDAFYGGFLESSQYTTENAAAGGLGLLMAYQVTGTVAYLLGSRAAASFLRNVQAIGKNGTHFTSSDSAGTARLYTGALASYVANVSGFYSDHRFYPSQLLVLEFWNRLKAVDGDQDIGAPAAVTGFDTAPNVFLSSAIADLRAFWSVGTKDATQGATVQGFSSSKPYEDFNAYPSSKPNTSPAVTGTGSWEYQDGAQGVGTLVTGLNWAKGLMGLYAFEGYSSQVTDVDNFVRGFSSNPTYQSAINISPQSLAASSTGTYVATQGVSTLLNVTTKQNGSTLYDWGALGCLARLWAAKHGQDLSAARVNAIGLTQRFQNGIPSDNANYDRIAIRGRSGLSFQTSFTETIAGRSRRVNDAVAASQWAEAYRV